MCKKFLKAPKYVMIRTNIRNARRLNGTAILVQVMLVQVTFVQATLVQVILVQVAFCPSECLVQVRF